MALLNRIETPSKTKAVRFQINYNLRNLLLDFVNDRGGKNYQDLVCKIRDVGQEIRDDDLTQLLKEARGCISILDGNFRLFVQAVLLLQWSNRSEEVINEFQGFLLDLCAAHNYFTKIVMDHLIGLFKMDIDKEWPDGLPSEEVQRNFDHVHHVLKSVVDVIPMAKDIIISSVQSGYPFFKRPSHEHELYVYNVICIIKYLPAYRFDLLHILITKLLAVEVHLSREDLGASKMEVDGVFELESDAQHSTSQALDLGLGLLFKYIQTTVETEKQIHQVKIFYNELFKIFEEVVFPTHSTHHTQFLMFYLLGLKPSLAVSFLHSLWSNVTNPNMAPLMRQISVCYIASLLARAKYVSTQLVREMLTKMCDWIHSYIARQDESGTSQDIRMHCVFYYTCQALFYVIAFRHKDLTQNQGLVMLQGMNLSKIVTCRLNPLKPCLPFVVSNFASVARSYQLAYCYSIIERNSRNTLPQLYRAASGALVSSVSVHLEAFFPFDPYLLVKSKQFITPFYREYTVGEQDLESHSNPNEDEDDFLESPPVADSNCKTFSYSSSPGFLHLA